MARSFAPRLRQRRVDVSQQPLRTLTGRSDDALVDRLDLGLSSRQMNDELDSVSNELALVDEVRVRISAGIVTTNPTGLFLGATLDGSNLVVSVSRGDVVLTGTSTLPGARVLFWLISRMDGRQVLEGRDVLDNPVDLATGTHELLCRVRRL